jgi:signal transduction histidine kinase
VAPGVGLGLSVSRRLIEAHRGTLDVSSTVGSGSTFSIRLPLCAEVTRDEAATVH